MKLRPDGELGAERGPELGRAAFVGASGAGWGIGFARFLAEVALWPPAYRSPLVAGGVALACAVVALAVWRWSTLASDASWSCAAPLALALLYGVGAFSSRLAGGALLAGGVVLAVLLAWRDRPAWLLPVLVGATCLGIYLFTLLPSVGEADTLEFQVVVAKLGIAHPTGYPLYILLAKLFTFLPFGNVAWRVNLASAVFAVAAVLVLFDLVRGLTGRPVLSSLTALSFALSSTFWSQALIAEVYTLHNLLVAALFWLLLRNSRGVSDGELGQARRWQIAFFLLGLSLTNHLTTVLLIPAVVLALVWDRPKMKPRAWLVGGGLFLLGFSVLLYLPLRWPALNDGRWMTVKEFLTYVTGGQFRGALRLDGWRDLTRWRIVGRLLRQPFGWAGIGLGALGAGFLAVRRRRSLALTAVTFVGFVMYGVSYYVADVAVFLLPAHLVLAVWIGVGVCFLADALVSVPSVSPDVWRPGFVALFALLPLSRAWGNLPAVDRSGDLEAYPWGRYVLDQPLTRDSAILADPKKFAPLYYLQQVEGVRPDLDIVLLGSEELYQADLRRRLGQGQVVYLARYLPALGEFYLRSVGPLAEVRRQPRGNSPVSGDVTARFGERLRLLDADVSRDQLGREIVHLTLRWQAEASVGGDYVVRVRLADEDGMVAWTSEGSRPVNGLYPTNAWVTGVPVSDYHEVPIAPWLSPGRYRLEVALFPPFGDEGLPVDDGSTVWLTLETLEVEPPTNPAPLSQWTLLDFGGAWLTGLDAPAEASAGSPLVLDLGWRGIEHGERVRLSWMNAEGRPTGVTVHPLEPGARRSRHTITTPSVIGAYTLRVGLVDELARCEWLAPPAHTCPLAGVEVRASREGLANFANRVLLLEAEVGRQTAVPGELVPVRLLWRGLRPLDEDYTVFVHLVGPDGRPHGQVDSWPVQGSFPTSQWSPGREVVDRYQVQLDPDAPPGEYRVEVGWYLLETMQRLRVVDEAGNPIADSFLAGRLGVR